MAWNKQQMKLQLIELQQRMAKVSSEEELLALKFDYYELCTIYNMIEKKNPIALEKKDYFSVCNSFIEESSEAILKYKNKLVNAMNILNNQPFLKPKNSQIKKIDYDKYLQMVGNFLYEFDEKSYNLFNSLSNNIQLTKTRKVVKNAKGICYYLYSLKEPYILADLNLKKSFSTLPHEIEHVNDFIKIEDFFQNLNFRCSTFVEVNPKFMALLFEEFYQHDELALFCLTQRKNFFDNLRSSIEVYSSLISQMNFYDDKRFYDDRDSDKVVPRGYINHIVSDLIALYILNMYKNDRNKYNEFISNFHKFKGISDVAIWDLIDFNDLVVAIKEEMYSFNNDVYNTRKRSKAFDLI